MDTRTHLSDMSTSPFVYLAPLRGITDVTFRTVYANHFGGFDMAVAPFLNPQQSPSNKKKLLADIFIEDNQALPVIPQLLNNRAEDFLYMANKIEELGYSEINWNLGCPAPMVANKGRGSGLLPYPEEIFEILDTVLPKMRAKLSIKMRLGFRDPAESLVILPRLNDYPLTEIIIHPRIGKQMYKGTTNLDGFTDCLGLTSHRVVFNGDITSREIFLQLQKRFPTINRWMIGRGVLCNPLLAEEIRHPDGATAGNSCERIRHFHDELLSAYREKLSGPGHLIGKMKQLWLYLASSFPGKEKALKKIKKAKTEEQLLAAIELMFMQV